MKEEVELIQDQITVLTRMQLSGLPREARADMYDALDTVSKRYCEAVDKRDAENASEADKKYYTGICDSVSKGLPDITKGALAAASAFQKGDSINGAAAIMDICAAAAPIIGSLVAAGGPPGALVGALFAVVGQLLAFFGPQQPSLKEQIKELLHGMNAEEELKNLEGVRLNIRAYGKLLTDAAARLQANDPRTGKRLLERDLLTEADADAFEIEVKALNYTIALSQLKSIVSEFESWKVAGWLKMPEKQGYERWPEVLAVWCRTYLDFVTANMTFIGLVDLQRVKAVMAYHHEDGSHSPLPTGRRKAIRSLMRDLAALVSAQHRAIVASNRVALEVQNDIAPAARDRGLFLHVGSGYLYACTGRSAIQQGAWTYLKGASDDVGSGYGYISRITATVPPAELGIAVPRYHCFLQRPKTTDRFTGATFARRISLKSSPETNDDHPITHWFNNLEWSPGVADLCAHLQDDEVAIYMAVKNSMVSVVLNSKGQVDNRGWRIDGAKSNLSHIRAVSAKALAGDPDHAALAAGSPSGVLYGGLPATGEIWMTYNNVLGYVPSPWTQYVGIAADRHFLWVFGTGGFACATHASVIKALQDRVKGGQTKPRWIEHYPNSILYQGITPGDGLVAQKPGEPPLRGLIDLSACDDDTLTLSLATREYGDQGKYTGDTGANFYTATHSVDVRAGTIQIADWTKFGGGYGTQVLKLPVHCWEMFQSMRADLSAS